MPIRTRSDRADSRASWAMASGEPLGAETWPPTQSESMGMASRAGTSSRPVLVVKPRVRPGMTISR